MSEWKEYKLGELLQTKGYIRGPFGSALKRGELFDEGIPVYEQQHAIYNRRVFRFFINEAKYEEMRRFTVQTDDIIISCSGTVGEVSIIKENDPKGIISQALLLLRVNSELILPNYLLFFLKSKNGHNAIVSCSSGSVQINIAKREVIENIPLLLPSVAEQNKIVAILSSLDDKIDLLRRENATLEAMAETLFKELVLNKENEGTLEQIISIQNGYAFKSKDFKDAGTHKVIKIKNISDSIVNIDTTDFVDDNAIIGLSPKFKISSGDILIAMTGAEIGKLGIIPQNDKSLWLNQRVGLLVEKFKGSKYLAYLQLKSDFGQDYIENTATGSAQPNISGVGIEKCGFPIFKQEDLIQISLQIDELYDKIIFNLGQINVLKDTRDFLLPKLMNNEIKI